ncbi:MAG: hypothetical protein AAB633_01350 [Patescibacteria group bacterium]
MFDKPSQPGAPVPPPSSASTPPASSSPADLTGHPIMDKPTAVESGRLQPTSSPPPPPSLPPAQLAGPVLAPAQSHKAKWIILGVVLLALLGVLGVWVYTLNRPSDAGDAAPAVTVTPEPVPDGDADKDGLMDSRERELGTDKNNPDSDNDGLTDNEEATLWNTDPLINDTDKDGFLDGEEVDNGYNPNGAGKLFNVNDVNL